MIRLIEQTLKPLVEAMGYVGQYGGIAKPVVIPMETENGTINRVFPVSCYLSAFDCFETGKYNDLVPDDQYASIAYFEQRGGATITVDGPKRNRWFFTEQLRFVCWLNYPKLGIGDCLGPERFALQFLSNILTVHEMSVDGLTGRVNITRASIVDRDHRKIFGQYSYSDKQWAFFHPYDYFAVDFTAQLEIPGGCVNDVTLGSEITCVTTY